MNKLKKLIDKTESAILTKANSLHNKLCENRGSELVEKGVVIIIVIVVSTIILTFLTKNNGFVQNLLKSIQDKINALFNTSGYTGN